MDRLLHLIQHVLASHTLHQLPPESHLRNALGGQILDLPQMLGQLLRQRQALGQPKRIWCLEAVPGS